MKIGFFDSGIGGITVLHEALRVLPLEKYIYYADTKNVPYGTKTKDQIKEYVFKAIEFIVQQEVDAVVIACNTATSAAVEDVRKAFNIPIIGMEPAVKPAVERNINRDKRVLVTATEFTLKEEKLKNLIEKVDNDNIIDLLPLPGLVEFAERFEFREEVVLPYLVEQLSKFNLDNYGTIVLGCTHFPLFKDVFRKIIPTRMDMIDGSSGTVKNLKKILENKGCASEGSREIIFYQSGIKIVDETTLLKYNKLLKRLDEISEI
ncbi:glutamate racemase [Fervidicella metallireducens AeB]|uniref:Glutamate racemase n=1 Tax=Fervidicella metallireducens AeB TaxID=1403537 RepID=A0A017RTH2_9CLOT|nr:glutamate racemase [Fervidicella metallireducens]EYE87195.1 glutamate racemase [Fervidicella metallireducens AeB]